MKSNISKAAAMALAMGAYQAISCETNNAMYSDHVKLALKNSDISVAQLNTAQFGVIKIFPDSDNGGYKLSPVYRLPEHLKLIHDNKQSFSDDIKETVQISKNEALTLEEKNNEIAVKSKNFMAKIKQIGLPITNMIMAPSQTYNPTATNESWKTPEILIKGPSFLVEDTNTHGERLVRGYKTVFESNPDIATLQEVQFGEQYDIDFTALHTKILSNYPQYSFTLPSIALNNKNYKHVVITYFNSNIFTDVSNTTAEITKKTNELLEAFGHLGAKNERIQIHALKHKKSNENYFVVNIHGDYNYTNLLNNETKQENNNPYNHLADQLATTPNLIVAGDFNVKSKNKEYFKPVLEKCEMYTFELTPEDTLPEGVGNPTYDAIFISKKK